MATIGYIVPQHQMMQVSQVASLLRPIMLTCGQDTKTAGAVVTTGKSKKVAAAAAAFNPKSSLSYSSLVCIHLPCRHLHPVIHQG